MSICQIKRNSNVPEHDAHRRARGEPEPPVLGPATFFVGLHPVLGAVGVVALAAGGLESMPADSSSTTLDLGRSTNVEVQREVFLSAVHAMKKQLKKVLQSEQQHVIERAGYWIATFKISSRRLH